MSSVPSKGGDGPASSRKNRASGAGHAQLSAGGHTTGPRVLELTHVFAIRRRPGRRGGPSKASCQLPKQCPLNPANGTAHRAPRSSGLWEMEDRELWAADTCPSQTGHTAKPLNVSLRPSGSQCQITCVSQTYGTIRKTHICCHRRHAPHRGQCRAV